MGQRQLWVWGRDVGLKRLGEKRLKGRVEKGRGERGGGGGGAGRGRMGGDFYRVDAGTLVWRGRDGEGNLLQPGLGGGLWLDRTRLGALLGGARRGWEGARGVVVVVVVLFVIFERTGCKIAGPLGVPITLELGRSAGEWRRERRTYVHGTFDDGDDIV